VTARSIMLFIAAVVAEIGGAYLVWIGVKDHKGIAYVALGAMALTAYGVVAAFPPSHEFGRVPPAAPALRQADFLDGSQRGIHSTRQLSKSANSYGARGSARALGDVVGPLIEPLDVLVEGAVAQLEHAQPLAGAPPSKWLVARFISSGSICAAGYTTLCAALKTSR